MIVALRRLVAFAILALSVGGCGSAAHRDVTVLQWYAAPESFDVAALAGACSQQSGGRYLIDVVTLPDDVDERRQALLRRLLAHDDADIVSVDASLTAELGSAGVLAPVPKDQVAAFTDGTFAVAEAASRFDGDLVTVPWWVDPYILLSRDGALQRAGLNPAKAITWDQLIAGAGRAHTPLAIDDAGGAGLAALVNALVVDNGGVLIDGTDRSPLVGLRTSAGWSAATTVSRLAAAGVGPGLSASAVDDFVSGGAFLIAPSSVLTEPGVDDLASDLTWHPFPLVGAGDTGGAPLLGMGLGVPLHAADTSASYRAIRCLTSEHMQVSLMSVSAHAAARVGAFADPSVAQGNPLAALLRASLEHGVNEPSTPYWHLVRRAIEQTWWPLSQVRPATTPRESQERVSDLVAGDIG